MLRKLGIIISNEEPKKIKLGLLRELVNSHCAFSNKTKLEKLINERKCPKFHSELSVIERLWCYSKYDVKRENDQDLSKLNEYITDSMKKFKFSMIKIKLSKRFFDACEMYNAGATYEDVLTTLFVAKSSAKVNSHKKK